MILAVPVFFLEGFLWDSAMISNLDLKIFGALMYQSLVTASFGFLAWITMLQKYGAVALHSFIFIMPIAGVLLGGLVLDIEYIRAVQREKNSINAIENKESAWFATVAYQAAEWLDIACRYEGFDDDIPGDQDGHLDNRFSIGFTWTIFEKDDFATNFMAEYRRSLFEKAAGSTADDNLSEFFAKLVLEY